MKKTVEVLILLLAIGGYFGSPYWTVHQMRAAAKDRDGDRRQTRGGRSKPLFPTTDSTRFGFPYAKREAIGGLSSLF